MAANKTIKVYIEGGVCTGILIPNEFKDKLDYEIIDYDDIEAEGTEKNFKKFKEQLEQLKEKRDLASS